MFPDPDVVPMTVPLETTKSGLPSSPYESKGSLPSLSSSPPAIFTNALALSKFRRYFFTLTRMTEYWEKRSSKTNRRNPRSTTLGLRLPHAPRRLFGSFGVAMVGLSSPSRRGC